MTYYQKINDLVAEYFGLLTFEELEIIFDTPLFGLSEKDTESKLQWMRDEWFEMEWDEVMSIMAEFDKEI